MKHRPSSFALFFFFTTLLLATLACNALVNSAQGDEAAPEQAEIVAAAVATLQAQSPAGVGNQTIGQTEITVDSSLQDVFVDLYARTNPSVVFILSSVEGFPLGTGSGFVFDALGHIVTNRHVIADGEAFEVVFADGTRREASVVGQDIDSDLAVIEVSDPPSSAPPIGLGNSDEISVGQLVLALGSPFGQQGSMSLGIISGLGRSLESQRDTGIPGAGSYSLPQVIQTDAPINPGNSGGPLLNLNGEVVGVNSAIRTQTGVNSGVGFAIPVNAVRRIVPALISMGSYSYPFMGITSPGGALTLVQQEAYGLSEARGVYVTSVTPDSPAEAAGLIAAGSDSRGGDLIVAVDGRPVSEFNDLISYLVFETEVGQTIDLTVVRGEEELELPLTLGERP